MTEPDNVVNFEKKTIEAEVPPEEAENPIERDIKNRSASSEVRRRIKDKIEAAAKIGANMGDFGSEKFKHCTTEVLKMHTECIDTLLAGMSVMEHEDVNLTTQLHHAYVTFMETMDKRQQYRLEQRLNEYTLAFQRLNQMLMQRVSEILRLEHTITAMKYALCEQGVFLQFPEPEEFTEEYILEREERVRKNADAYQNASKRIFEERLGIEHKRGPYGETRLPGGINIQLYNLDEQ